MKAVSLVLLSAVMLCRVPAASAQVDLPAAAQEVLKQFEQENADLEKKADADLQKLREKIIVELKKQQDIFCKEAKLDEAVAIRDLIRRLQAGNNGPLAADLPPAAKEVCKQHEDELADFHKKVEAGFKKLRDKIGVELKKIQDAFCKEAKLDEAVAVRDLIRNIRDGVSNAVADPGYINNAAADIGKVFYYQVTGVDVGQSIYGTDIYTTGSHLGMAAVHCGLLKAGQRGVVKVTILPGQANYAATTRHGITSYAYGSWGVSFKVERSFGFIPKQQVNAFQPDPGTLVTFRAEVGKSFLFEVTGSNAGSVWGTDIYTDDSSLATAAVHAGVLTPGQKAIVKVTILPGQAGYADTTRYGVSSGSWQSWHGSFRVEGAK